MKTLIRNLRTVLIFFICLCFLLLTGLFLQQSRSQKELSVAAGENKQSLKTRYAKAGEILDRNGNILAESKDGERIYNDDPETASALLQIVGDYTHNMENTIEAKYQNVLLGTDRNLFTQLLLDIQGKGLHGDSIMLTADAELSKKAFALLGDKKGSIVLLNYQTGEVLCAVSTPSTSPSSVINYENIPDTALFNRALFGNYAPGSTFKIFTAAAWLTSSSYDPGLEIYCDTHSTVDPFGANESGNGHGAVQLDAAFAHSCNVFFGQVGVNIGTEHLLSTTKNMGYGASFSLDALSVQTAKSTSADIPSTLSWFSIGQPTAESELYMTPLQMAMTAGSIGNGGVEMKPHIVDCFITPTGKKYASFTPEELQRTMSPETAAALENLMLQSTSYGTGTAAAVPGYTVASKTGTVQVEGLTNTALTVAYITEDDMPYAIAVVVEEGGSGGGTAAPIAGKMLAAAVEEHRK